MTANYFRLTGGLLRLQRWMPTRRLIVPFLQVFPGVFDWGLHYLMR